MEETLPLEGYKEYESILYNERDYEKSYFKNYDDENNCLKYALHFHFTKIKGAITPRRYYEVCLFMKINGMMNEIYIRENFDKKMTLYEIESYAEDLWLKTRGN